MFELASPDALLAAGKTDWRTVALIITRTGRIYPSAPAGIDLFPRMRPACVAPTARKHSRQLDKWTRTEESRRKLKELRPLNTEQRQINQARAQEIDRRQWRNNMRKTPAGSQRRTAQHQPLLQLGQRPARRRAHHCRLRTSAPNADIRQRRSTAVLTTTPKELSACISS